MTDTRTKRDRLLLLRSLTYTCTVLQTIFEHLKILGERNTEKHTFGPTRTGKIKLKLKRSNTNLKSDTFWTLTVLSINLKHGSVDF